MPANDYITKDDIKNNVPDITTGAWSTKYDVVLTRLATLASRDMDRFTGRQPGAYKVTTDGTFYFDGTGGRKLFIPELSTAPTKVEVAEGAVVDTAPGAGDGVYTIWDTASYLCWPYNAANLGRPYTQLHVNLLMATGRKAVWYAFPKAVKVTGKWGFSASPPDEIVDACLALAIHQFKRIQQLYRDTGAIIELGTLQYTKALPPEVDNAILHYRRIQT